MMGSREYIKNDLDIQFSNLFTALYVVTRSKKVSRLHAMRNQGAFQVGIR
jgi:hypothetical protein